MINPANNKDLSKSDNIDTGLMTDEIERLVNAILQKGDKEEPRGKLAGQKRKKNFHSERAATKVKKEEEEKEQEESVEEERKDEEEDEVEEKEEEPELDPSYKDLDSLRTMKGRRQKRLVRCKYCTRIFETPQSLGGHVSRKHPGKSSDYNRKKMVRRRREFDRQKLLLAKEKYFRESGYDYEELTKITGGKKIIRRLLDRGKLKKIKRGITDQEVDNFVLGRLVRDRPEKS